MWRVVEVRGAHSCLPAPRPGSSCTHASPCPPPLSPPHGMQQQQQRRACTSLQLWRDQRASFCARCGDRVQVRSPQWHQHVRADRGWPWRAGAAQAAATTACLPTLPSPPPPAPPKPLTLSAPQPPPPPSPRPPDRHPRLHRQGARRATDASSLSLDHFSMHHTPHMQRAPLAPRQPKCAVPWCTWCTLYRTHKCMVGGPHAAIRMGPWTW